MPRSPQPLIESPAPASPIAPAAPIRHLLSSLSGWHRELAAALARSNPFTEAQSQAVAQRFLDRLLFVRFAEAQAVEPPGTVSAVVHDWERAPHERSLYAGFGALFQSLAGPWGGGLFAAHALADQAQLADSATLLAIVRGLELAAQRCRFARQPLTFLGSVYEQQCEQRLREGMEAAAEPGASRSQTRRHQAGIYYTPDYIVDAIIERTLAPLLADATPARVLDLRIFDPACGAGAFLLAALAYLSKWHLRYYERQQVAGPQHGRFVYKDADGTLRLRPGKLGQLLSRCLHGCDRDPRAVELTRMSLLFVLRREQSCERAVRSHPSSRVPALPLLTDNLRCGDTLLLPPSPGSAPFSAIVGNPPYVRIQALAASAASAAAQYRQRYTTTSTGSYDLYVVFIERCLQLLRRGGRLGFIIPSKWWQAAYGAPLRRLLGQGRHYAEIHDFAAEQVFAEPTTYTCISVFTKSPTARLLYRRASPAELRRNGLSAEPRWDHALDEPALGEAPFHPGVPAALRPLFERLRRQGPFLADPAICPRIFQGLKTGLDAVFVLEPQTAAPAAPRYFSPALGEPVELEPALLHPLTKGRELKRFAALPPRKMILFPYELHAGTASLIPPERLAREFPAAWDYLQRTREVLLRRERARLQGPEFYKYTRSQALAVVGLPKLLTADLAECMAFSQDPGGRLYLLGGAAGGYGLLPAQPELAAPLLALLNSSLLEWLLRPPGLSTPFRGGWFSCEARFIAQLPIHVPERPAERAALAELAEKLTTAYAALPVHHPSARPPASPIAALEAELDDRVFSLYAVTASERRLVVQALAKARGSTAAAGNSADPRCP